MNQNKESGGMSGTDPHIDPVCGMTVDPQKAKGSYEYNGEMYYFCSTHCLEKFIRNPEQYVKKK